MNSTSTSTSSPCASRCPPAGRRRAPPREPLRCPSSRYYALTTRGVDVSGVALLPDVPSTPGEVIRYDKEQVMTYESVGWENWAPLCSWVPPLPDMAEWSACHVLVEGGTSACATPPRRNARLLECCALRSRRVAAAREIVAILIED